LADGEVDVSMTRFGGLSVNLARSRAKGLRLVASDAGWSWGTGPLVSGPGEALLMAINGRPDALPELTGLGALTARVDTWSANFAAP
jgi:hypothetical protein